MIRKIRNKTPIWKTKKEFLAVFKYYMQVDFREKKTRVEEFTMSCQNVFRPHVSTQITDMFLKTIH